MQWLTVLTAAALLFCVLVPRAEAAAPAGGLLAFGSNDFGELGNSTNNESVAANPTPTPVGLAGQLGTIDQVAVGGGHTLVATSSGQLYAFGLNYYGELGNAVNDGTENANPTPTAIGVPGEIGGVTQVAAGGSQSLVVTGSGQLYGFGYNYYGELGTTTNNGSGDPNPTPMLVTLPGESGTITQVATGYDHTLVLTSSGQLYAFGHNDDGQLGITTNSGTDTPNPTPTLVGLPGQVGTITQVAAGEGDSIVLTSAGQVYTFGLNDYGQLGTTVNSGTTTANPTPTLVSLPGQVGTVTQVAAGSQHDLVLTSGGQLYSFGENYFGELGTPTNSGTDTPNPTPALVTLPGQIGAITQLGAGDVHSLAVTSSGQLYTFGGNYDGELGNTTNNGHNTPNPTPTVVSFDPGTTIDTVATGAIADDTVAIVSDLSVTSSSLPAASIAQAYSTTVSASGGTAPLSFSASGLPAGLAIDPTSGAITGTPTSSGTSSVAVTVTDRYGSQSSATLTLTVNPAAVTAPTTAATTTTPTTTPVPAATAKLTRLVIAPGTVSLTGHTVKGKCVATTSKNRRDRSCRFAIKLTAGYTASAKTTLTVHLSLLRAGRKSGKTCVAQTKKNAKAAACTRVTTLKGQLTHAVTKSGTGTFTLSGTFAGHTLAAGRYRMTVTPKGGVARTATFTITK